MINNNTFVQNEILDVTRYGVNIPMRYYYKGKFRHGWININNPFRGTFVIGTPGSGKSFSVINKFMQQQSEKKFSMAVYDDRFPMLAKKLYYQYQKGKQTGNLPDGCEFNIINFTNVEYSRRVNPIQHKYIPDLGAALEIATTLMESLQGGRKEGGINSDDFFFTSAVNFLAACIFFFVNYKRLPYDKDGNELIPEYTEHKKELTGRVFNHEGKVVTPAYWLGKYSDLPHVLSFLQCLDINVKTMVDVLKTDHEVYPMIVPFKSALEGKAMEQLENMIGSLRVLVARLATKEAYWVLHKDGDDFDLKISDPKNPSYLLIANDPEKQIIISPLNAMILNRMVTQVNSGEGENIPVSIIIDELPAVYMYRIYNVIATARKNNVGMVLGCRDLSELKHTYSKIDVNKITSTIGNVISSPTQQKETLEWLSKEIFGEDKPHNGEDLKDLVPASKIAEMPADWICGQVDRDFTTSTEQHESSKFFCKTEFPENDHHSERNTCAIPKFYKFKSEEEKNHLLHANYKNVSDDIDNLIQEVLNY